MSAPPLLHLRVLGPERLVGRRPPRPDDCHRHVELPSRRGVSVTGAAQLRHAVDAEVCVHQLNDRPEPVHALAQSLGVGGGGEEWDGMEWVGWDGMDGMGWDRREWDGVGRDVI